MRGRPPGKLKAAAAALYEKDEGPPANPFLAALAARGGERVVEVWPDNHAAFNLFNTIGTQWRVGMGGATGLDYAAVYPLLDRAAKDPQEWDEMFSDIQVMEGAALKQMSENRSDT